MLIQNLKKHQPKIGKHKGSKRPSLDDDFANALEISNEKSWN